MGHNERIARKAYGAYHRDKTGHREDEELTHVGPETPGGEYFRCFWHPIALTTDVESAPLRLRILGEDLVLFRDLSGRLGLLELHCPHRGTSLEFGKLDETGIRCCYHGWHFDIDGTILETPTHSDDNSFKDRIYHGAYPVHEYAGMIWAYMGPPESTPDFPIFDIYEKPGVTHTAYKFFWPCNWLQIRENGMDPLHAKYLHADAGQKFPPSMKVLPVLDFQESPLGILYISVRRIGEMLYLRQNEIFLPTADWVNGLEDAEGETVFDRRGGGTDFVVPIDDANSYFFMLLDVTRNQHDTRLNGLWDRDTSEEIALGLNASIPTSGQHGDRPYDERQLSAGDWDACTSQGTIHGHGGENLGISDTGVVKFRNLIRREIDKVKNGHDPKGVYRNTNGQPIRTHGHNTVLRVPQGGSPEADRKICEALYREFITEVIDGDLQQTLPVDEKWRIARKLVERITAD